VMAFEEGRELCPPGHGFERGLRRSEI
jgi:hypothetical protein